jgi:hypothetical protein
MTVEIGHRVRKTSRRMADGREIIYFDDTEPFVSREAVDVRPSPPVGGATAEMRYDPLTGEWVSLAVHRNDRTFMPPVDQDPPAPTEPGAFPTEIAESSYDVACPDGDRGVGGSHRRSGRWTGSSTYSSSRTGAARSG